METACPDLEGSRPRLAAAGSFAKFHHVPNARSCDA